MQIVFYTVVFTAVYKKSKPYSASTEPVSVVICARNNLSGLEQNLPKILNQHYPNFEVIVVNDGSTDGTIDFLDELAKTNDKLRVLHLDIDERYHRGKKFAQTIGIKAAKNELLLFTDSDCAPSSNQWIAGMTSGFQNGKEIVLGVSNYTRSASPLNWLIQLETFHTALQYVNYALGSKAYMGVGRNMAYTRALFFKVKGFASHQHILSGDDDLFVNETATKDNVAVVLLPETFTLSEVKGGFLSWYRQKRRHFSTGKLYKSSDKLKLSMYSLSLFVFYVTLIPLLVMQVFLIPVIAIYGVRLIMQSVILHRNMTVLNYQPYYAMFPLMDLGVIFIQLFVGVRGYFSKPKNW